MYTSTSASTADSCEIKVEREPPTLWKSCPSLFPALQKETSLEKTNKGVTHLQIKPYTYPVKVLNYV